jgi:hypothetical protein
MGLFGRHSRGANPSTLGSQLLHRGAIEESTLDDQGTARDYFAEYHSAIEAYERELKRAFGFAFMPECSQEGAEAPAGSELRRTYDAMVEAKKARDERHPPGTWMG